MSRINLIDSFSEFKEAEHIDRPTLIKVIEDVFKTLLRKKYYHDDNFDVIVNDQTGDLEIFQRREVVADEHRAEVVCRRGPKDAPHDLSLIHI